MFAGLHVKYPLFLSDFDEICIFSTDFGKIFKHQISWKSVQWDPRCSHVDGQTDFHEANIFFSRFCQRTWKWNV